MGETKKQENLEVENKNEINSNFCRCPFCPCCFFTQADLEKHIATFGNSRELHFENHRRTHARMEFGSANGPE